MNKKTNEEYLDEMFFANENGDPITNKYQFSKWIKVTDKEPPKDGSPFLGFDPNKDVYEQIYVLIYIPEKKYPPGEFFKLSHEAYYQEASGEGYFQWDPTHWMPLPSVESIKNK